MIGKMPNAAPSSRGVERLPDRHRVDDDRDEDRDAERDQRGPVRLQLQAAQQDEQRRRAAAPRRSSSAPSESPTGSSTCLYMRASPSRSGLLCATRTRRPCDLGSAPCGSRSSSPASTTRCSRRRAGRWSSCSSASGTRSTSREEQTCCGQMHGNTGYADARAALAASASSACSRRRGDRLAVGVVRRLRARAAAAVADRRVRADRVPRRRARRRGRRRVVPAPRDLPPDLPLAARCCSVGDRPLRLLRAVRGIDLVELAEAEECCGFGGTFAVKNADTSMAMLVRQAAPHPRHARRGLHGGRQLVPDAHRRRAAAPARRRARRCTWPRSWRRRNERGFPAAAPRGAAATPSCGATSARRRRRSAPSARGVVGGAARLGGAARRGRGDQGARDGDAARAARAARGGGDRGRRRRCTGRATAPRRTRSSPASRARTARAR